MSLNKFASRIIFGTALACAVPNMGCETAKQKAKTEELDRAKAKLRAVAKCDADFGSYDPGKYFADCVRDALQGRDCEAIRHEGRMHIAIIPGLYECVDSRPVPNVAPSRIDALYDFADARERTHGDCNDVEMKLGHEIYKTITTLCRDGVDSPAAKDKPIDNDNVPPCLNPAC